MLISVMPSQMAPLATAHPHALPAQPAQDRTAVRPAGDAETTGLGDDRGRGARSGQGSGNAATGSEDHAAPPTIMQMKIAAMQSETRATASPEDAQPEDARPDETQPGTGQPGTSQTDAAQPDTVQADTAQRNDAQPSRTPQAAMPQTAAPQTAAQSVDAAPGSAQGGTAPQPDTGSGTAIPRDPTHGYG